MVVFFAPLVVLGGLLTLPYLSNYEESTLATEIGANTTRWNWGSLLIAAGIGMMVLVVFAARTYLRDHGEDFWSFLAVPAVTLGAAMGSRRNPRRRHAPLQIRIRGDDTCRIGDTRTNRTHIYASDP
jgi:hypothetical protein